MHFVDGHDRTQHLIGLIRRSEMVLNRGDVGHEAPQDFFLSTDKGRLENEPDMTDKARKRRAG